MFMDTANHDNYFFLPLGLPQLLLNLIRNADSQIIGGWMGGGAAIRHHIKI
jgi:hypothetical protein